MQLRSRQLVSVDQSSSGSSFSVATMAAPPSENHSALFKPPSTLVPLSLSSSREKYSIWETRFYAHLAQSSVFREALCKPGVDLAKVKLEATSNFELACVITPCIGDDVLQHFRLQVSVQSDGVGFLQALKARFRAPVMDEESAEELLTRALRVRRSQFSSLAAFLQHLRDVLRALENATGQRVLPMAERLLMHHALDELVSGTPVLPWANELVARFRAPLRLAGKDVATLSSLPGHNVEQAKPLSFATLIEEVSLYLPAVPLVVVSTSGAGRSSSSGGSRGDSTTQCSYCGRSGHTHEKCWDKHGHGGRSPSAGARGGDQVNGLFADSAPWELNGCMSTQELCGHDAGELLIDSGASQHVVRDASMFEPGTYTALVGRSMYLADRRQAVVSGVGTVRRAVTVEVKGPDDRVMRRSLVMRLQRVLHVPALAVAGVLSTNRWVAAGGSVHLGKAGSFLFQGGARIPLRAGSKAALVFLATKDAVSAPLAVVSSGARAIGTGRPGRHSRPCAGGARRDERSYTAALMNRKPSRD